MLLTCPKCFTTYNVPSAAEKPEQKVRCLKCGHVWEPALDVIDPLTIDLSLPKSPSHKIIEDPVPSFQDFFKEPEKKSNNLIRWLKPLYFFSLFCIAASIYLFFFQPAKHPPVTLQTISYELEELDYKTFLTLKAVAFNNTDAEIRPKIFNVRFTDEKDRTLTTADIESPVDVLPPRSIEEITLRIERPPSKTAQAVLTLSQMEKP